jgi:hypothetical protein
MVRGLVGDRKHLRAGLLIPPAELHVAGELSLKVRSYGINGQGRRPRHA